MDCDKALELISLGLDGLLTAAEQRELDGHLAGCEACRSLASELAGLRDAMPEEEEPPVGFLDGVMERVRGAKVVPLASARKHRWKSWAAMAAVFAVVIAGSGGLKHAMEGNAADSAAGPQSQTLVTGAQTIAPTDSLAPAPTPGIAGVSGGARAKTVNPAETVVDTEAAGDVLEGDEAVVAAEPVPTPTPATPEPEGPAAPRMYTAAAEPSGTAEAGAVGPTAAMFSMDAPEETPPVEPEAGSNGLEPAMTEEEKAAMDRVLEYLGYEDDYTWDTPYAVLWPRQQDAEIQAALSYTGISENGGYYTFILSNRVYGFVSDEPEQYHSALTTNLAVPVDGGDIIEGAGPWYDALLSE